MPVLTGIADLRQLARRRVPRMFLHYLDAGSWTEGTLRANDTDLQAIRWWRVVGHPRHEITPAADAPPRPSASGARRWSIVSN